MAARLLLEHRITARHALTPTSARRPAARRHEHCRICMQYMPLRPDGYPASLIGTSYSTTVAQATIGATLATFDPATTFDIPVPPAYIPGMYTLMWDGNGTIRLDGDARGSWNTSAHGGKASVEVRTATGIFVRIMRTDPMDPVRNIRIIPATFERTYNTSQIFTPHFIELVRRFRAFRFAGWQRELSFNSARSWSQRVTRSSQTQAGPLGVALEHMFDLATLLNASAWLSIPVKADANYTQALAQWLVDCVSPLEVNWGGLVYVEYSSALGYLQPQATGLLALRDAIEAAIAALQLSADGTRNLRARFRFVAALSDLQYLPTVQSDFAAANNATARGVHAFYGLDVLAFSASLGAELRFGSPGEANFTRFMSMTDDEAVQMLRTSVLVNDVTFNRVFARAEYWQRNESLTILHVPWTGGFDLAAPSYGARSALRQLRSRAPGNVTEEHMIEASGAQLYFTGDIMRVDMPDMMHGLRTQGNNALLEGWQLGIPTMMNVPAPADGAFTANTTWRYNNDSVASVAADVLAGQAVAVEAFVRAVIAASPKFAAIAKYLDGEKGRLPYTSADITHVKPAPCAPACVYGTCHNGACICWAGAVGASCSQLRGRGQQGGGAAACGASEIGMNVAGLADYSTQLVYVNIQKQSRAWISQAGWQDFGFMGWSFGMLPPMDANGYPSRLEPGFAIGTMMLRDLRGHYPAGTYTVLYDGDGILDAWMDDVQAIRRIAPGRMEVDLKPTTGLNNGMFLRIERTNPADPIRNVRVIMPGFLDTYEVFPFYPPFLHFLRNYTTLRFMDLGDTNSQTDVDWTDRALPEHRTYTIKGMPVEHMVLLSNTLGASMWVNIPHAASDSYIHAFATYVHANLRPDLNVTVEYSNEVWGTLFPGGQYAQARGVAANLDQLSTRARGADEARFCFYGIRSAEIFDIWKQVFTNGNTVPQERSRLRFVLSSQFVNPDVSIRILSCNASGFAADALAVAPYLDVHLTRGNTGRDSDLLDIATIMNTSLPTGISSLVPILQRHAALARQFNLSLVTYEAGQGLAGGSAKAQALAQAVNLHRGMRDVYANYTRTLLRSGVSLVMHFSSVGLGSQYGYWGLVEALDSNPSSQPKVQGLAAVVDELRQCPFAPDSRDITDGPDVDADCPVGYDDAAQPTTCSGHGTCMDFPATGARGKLCGCFEGYRGTACEDANYVDFSTCSWRCSGHGTCVLRRIDGFKRYFGCACDAGYGGDHCTVVTCPKHCSWNGRCVDANKCKCYRGYDADDCSTDCGCGNHGQCAWQAGVSGAAKMGEAIPPACACDSGYSFERDGGAVLSPRTAEANATYFASGRCVPVCRCRSANQTCVRPGVCSCDPACKYGTCISGACVCWAGYGGRACTRRLRPSVAAELGALTTEFSPMGINLGGINYWTTGPPFIDIMKTSAPWLSQHTEAGRPSGVYIWNLGDTYPQNLTADGWPRSLIPGVGLGTLLARDVGRRLPDGRYIVTYEGNGDLFFSMDARIIAESKGRIELDVRLTTVRDNGIYMRIEEVDEINPIRNIRVLMPGLEELADDGLEFHPAFLESLKDFSALRFMDWSATNENAVREWSDRNVLTSATYANVRGAPVESMVHLCNILGANPWFNMPANATAEYVRNFAEYVRDHLRPDLTIFVERSNEVWNALFSAGKANYEEARALGMTAPALHAARSVQMFREWANVFGPVARRERLVHVLSTQTVSTWITREMLTYNNTWQEVDAIGVTAYIDCGGLGGRRAAAWTAQLTVEQILDKCDEVRPTVAYSWQKQIEMIDSILSAADARTIAASPSATPSLAPTASPTTSHSPSLNASADQLEAPPLEFGFDLSVLGRPLKPNVGRLPLIVYEGGPGLVEQAVIEGGPRANPTEGLTDKLVAAMRHPRMEHVYRAYLDTFGALGLMGGRANAYPFMHFAHIGVASKYGSWGMLEYLGQPLSEAPRARAISNFVHEIVSNLTRRGCMNPSALNFDPRAKFSDDSCRYAPTPVDTTGGVVAPPNEPLALLIAPGALQETVEISVELVPAQVATPPPPDSYLVSTPVYRFGPPGTSFLSPITACIQLNLTEVEQFGWGRHGDDVAAGAGGSENVTLALYHSSNGVNWTASEKSWFNSSTNELCGWMWHFTLASGMRVEAGTVAVDVETALQERISPSASASVAPSLSSSYTASSTSSASMSATSSETASATSTATASRIGDSPAAGVVSGIESVSGTVSATASPLHATMAPAGSFGGATAGLTAWPTGPSTAPWHPANTPSSTASAAALLNGNSNFSNQAEAAAVSTVVVASAAVGGAVVLVLAGVVAACIMHKRRRQPIITSKPAEKLRLEPYPLEREVVAFHNGNLFNDQRHAVRHARHPDARPILVKAYAPQAAVHA